VKKFSVFLVILVCLLTLGLVFVSCDDGSTGGGDGDNNGSSGDEGYTKGWPPNNVLSDFAIGGLSQPAGMTNPKWKRTDNSYFSELDISFDEQTDSGVIESINSSVLNYLRSNGWEGTDYGVRDCWKTTGGFKYIIMSYNPRYGYLTVVKSSNY